jgi:hypothetical protein
MPSLMIKIVHYNAAADQLPKPQAKKGIRVFKVTARST